MARVEMIVNKEQVAPDQHGEFDSIVEVLNDVSGPFSVLMYSPGLAERVMRMGAHIRLNSSLSMRDRELAILAVAREKDGRYEWAAHVPLARRSGVTEAAISAVREGGDVTGLEPDERDIIRYVRDLLRTNRVDRVLFDELLHRHDVRWTVELTATIGQYQYISAINNAFEVLPGTDAEQLPITATTR